MKFLMLDYVGLDNILVDFIQDLMTDMPQKALSHTTRGSRKYFLLDTKLNLGFSSLQLNMAVYQSYLKTLFIFQKLFRFLQYLVKIWLCASGWGAAQPTQNFCSVHSDLFHGFLALANAWEEEDEVVLITCRLENPDLDLVGGDVKEKLENFGNEL